jgi:hypothetical protein
MLIRQFNIKGKPAEMFDFIKRLYMKKLQEEAGYHLNIPNNQILIKLIEEKYKQLKEE